MKTVWVGFHDEGVLTFKALAKAGRLSACITLNPLERAKRSGAARFDQLSAAFGIPCFEIRNINDDFAIKTLEVLAPDLLLVIGWSQILGERVLSIPKIGSIGAHASLLPAYRGSAPVNWAIINGLTQTGNTLIWLRSGVDTGEIIEQRSFSITRLDTCATLYKKVAATNRDMVQTALAKLETTGWYGTTQKHMDVPPLPRRRPDDGRVEFVWSARRIYDFVRALTKPYPGAFAFHAGRQVVLWEASALLPNQCPDNLRQVGMVTEHVYSPRSSCNGLLVQCGEGNLLINAAQIGEHSLRGQSLLNAFPIGTKFE